MVNPLMSFPGLATILATVGLTVSLALIGWIDFRTLRIPDALSLPLVGLGLCWSALQPEPALQAHLIGAIAGYGVLALIGGAFFRLRGTEGLGLGDAKLFAAAGAWLGWQALPQVLLIAALAGLIYVLTRKAVGGPQVAQVAFGPWLALGFWLVWIWLRVQEMP
jgi:leader peptidase (prepilin peptidase)/N-methyltransferase